MNLFSKSLFCFIFFNLVLMPLMAEDNSVIGMPKFRILNITDEIQKQPDTTTSTTTTTTTTTTNPKTTTTTINITKPKQIEETIRIKNRKRKIEPNTHRTYRTPHVQNKCNFISELDEIHQVGLNISQFMDIENFKALPRYSSGNKKADSKRNITIKAAQYFIDKGLSDPKEICNLSKKYFQDLAKKAYENGKYLLAYHYFSTAIEGEHFDNKELDDCKKYLSEKKKEFKHGDIFFFGKYEQDGNLKNGPEPIEWIVLRNTGEEIILLSKYVLAHKAFHTSDEMFIWENSTLCSWLNKDFYNEAFSDEEKKRMCKIGADWYEEEYNGDYVVIPVTDDLNDLVDNFWLRAYAVPSDIAAQDFINYDGKPFILSKDKNGNAKWYEYSSFLEQNQPNVLTANENVDKFSNFVYWPSGYWINQYNGASSSNGKYQLRYTFCDENGFLHTTKTKFYNGVRPVIKVAYTNIVKTDISRNSSIGIKKEFMPSELDEIHQIGLNIFKFMDFSSFERMHYFNKGEKKEKRRRDLIKNTVKYFTDKELYDPEQIYLVSKKYFQDLAEKAYESGDYRRAYKYFSTIVEGEKYNQPKLLDCREHIENNNTNLRSGDVVFFGKYEQDGNLENGPEPIEWIVLKKEVNKIILISKYVLTHKAIHSGREQFKWFESELCTWLNNDFYNAAFNESEKKRMCKVGGNIWYLKEYKGDYVVIPCFDDLKDLDNYWLKTYAVPNDKRAKDFISFDWKPFTVSKDEKGNIFYEPESGLDVYENNYREHQFVLTMNPNINNNSNLVYWPSRYWINHRNGNGWSRDDNGNSFNVEYYCYNEENGIPRGSLDAKNINGVRPLIGITYQDE